MDLEKLLNFGQGKKSMDAFNEIFGKESVSKNGELKTPGSEVDGFCRAVEELPDTFMANRIS